MAESTVNKKFFGRKKWASYLHRTAQPPILALFPAWGSSAGAGRIRGFLFIETTLEHIWGFLEQNLFLSVTMLGYKLENQKTDY